MGAFQELHVPSQVAALELKNGWSLPAHSILGVGAASSKCELSSGQKEPIKSIVVICVDWRAWTSGGRGGHATKDIAILAKHSPNIRLRLLESDEEIVNRSR